MSIRGEQEITQALLKRYTEESEHYFDNARKIPEMGAVASKRPPDKSAPFQMQFCFPRIFMT